MASATETPANGQVQQAPTPDGDIPGIELTENIVSTERESIGEITIDEMLRGEWGVQWHFGFKPLTYTINTKTGAVHEYVPTEKRGSRTKFGVIVSSLMLVLGDEFKGKTIGKGMLLGERFVFLEKDFKFGKDKDTGEEIVRTYVLFKRRLNDEDNAQVASFGSVVQHVPSSTFSDEQISAILGVVVGQTEASAPAAAAKSKLESSLKASVLSGVAIPAMLSSGTLVMIDGKYATPPAA